MTDKSLSPDLRRFIVARISSIPALEALLLLRSREPGWDLPELAARLYVSEADARRVVQDLERRGLARLADARAAYAPEDAATTAAVDDLSAVYASHLVEVSRLIHSSTDHKAHRFADAFVIRKEP